MSTPVRKASHDLHSYIPKFVTYVNMLRAHEKQSITCHFVISISLILLGYVVEIYIMVEKHSNKSKIAYVECVL